MNLLIAQSAALLLAVFLFSGFVGWHLSPKPKRAVRRTSIFDEAPAPLVDSTLDAPLNTPVSAPAAERPLADPMVAAAQTLNASRQAAQAPTALQAEFAAPRPSAEIIPLRPVAAPVAAAPSAPQPAPVGVSTELEPAIMAGIERPESLAEAPVEVATPVVAEPLAELLDRTSRPKASLLSSMTPESVRAAVEQAGTGLEPHRLTTPEGMPDDLTLISGIGADNERELNMLGVYHYWQVASWTPEHVAWLSARIHAAPRIVRENWMAQAARLAGRAA